MLDRTKSCYAVDWIHPENTLQIDSSSLCAIWIERIRKVNPRDKLTRMSRGRDQHLSKRRSARRNSPNNLRNCSARKSSTEEGVQRGHTQRKTATLIHSWSIGSDPKRNGVQLSNESRQPGGRCRHINRFALSSPNGQPPQRRDGRLRLTLHAPPDTESRRLGAVLAEVWARDRGRGSLREPGYGSPSPAGPGTAFLKGLRCSERQYSEHPSNGGKRARRARLEVVARRSTTLTR